MNRKWLELIDEGSCIALIPARGGSKSVPKKNIRNFKGHPLLAYSIAAAGLSKKIQRVIVSTDAEEIANIARHYGAEVPFLRPLEFARDDSPDIEFVQHAIEWMVEAEGKLPGCIVHLRPTTPIRRPEDIDNAIEMIRNDPNATSLRSGSLCAHAPFKWFKREGEYLTPLFQGVTCDEANMPRQGFPEVYIPNGYVDVLRTRFIIENDLIHGDKMIGYKTQEVPDIDTESDLRKLDFYQGLQEAFDDLYDYIEGMLERNR